MAPSSIWILFHSVKFEDEDIKEYLTEINTYFNKINKVLMLSQEEEDFYNSVLTKL